MTMQTGGRSPISSQSSVDHDGLARHVAVAIRSEKGGEAGDLVEAAEPAEGAVLEIVGQAMLRQIAADAVLEEAWRQADDANAVARDLFRQRLGQSFDCRLARAIVNRRF